MTEDPGQEPTIADVMRELRSLATTVREVAQRQETQDATLAELVQGQRDGRRELSELKARVEHGFGTQGAEIEAVAAAVHALDDLRNLPAEIANGLAQTEARLTSRIDDVLHVAQTTKANLAAHVADSEAHHRHAA